MKPPQIVVAFLVGALAAATVSLPAAAHPGHEVLEPPPAANFQKVPLNTDVTQPMSLAVARDGRVFFVERTGGIRVWKPDTGATLTAGAINVDTRGESGLQGIALDPDFAANGWLYVYYSAIEAPEKRLSRFHIDGDTVDPASEVVLLTAPTTFPPRPSHVGGSIEFDLDGNLILSTGDDTQPYESSGYTPIDERPGREEFDAQRSSANSNDLRGKLLRITPTDTAAGGYTIPEGNMFAPGTAKTRPEIFAMGFRNPFRIAVNPNNGDILVADYGPDANAANANRGPAGHVEWQTVSEPGFYGWPYCHGPNLAYNDYDFATSQSGPLFDCANPVNESPNNTGIRELPAVTAPEIAYSASTPDPDFPELGTGGAPMAGPVYQYDPDLDSDRKFPEYYDGKAIFYEWGKHFLATLDLDENGSPVHATRFLPDMVFNAPMDMTFGPDGAMYLAEWGRGFGRNNPDDGIYRIEYAPPGERAPLAVATAAPASGNAPLQVAFSSAGSADPDEGQTITYSWDFGDGAHSTEQNPSHTYAQNGNYQAVLTVTDPTGRTGSASVTVTVGNTAPQVEFVTPPDGGFIGEGDTVRYQVAVTDAEDQEIDCSRVVVQPAIGHDAHAHPLEELHGCEGTFTTSASGHGADANMFYVATATYQDNGAPGSAALIGTTDIMLQPKHRQAEHYSAQSGTSESRDDASAEGAYRVASISTGDWIAFDRMNLSGIDAIGYRVAGTGGGQIELRAGAPNGELLATTPIAGTGGAATYVNTPPASVIQLSGTHTLYLVFTAAQANAYNIDAIDFIGKGVAADVTAPEVAVTGVEDGAVYSDAETRTISWTAIDDETEVVTTSATLDGDAVQSGTSLELWTLPLGEHELVVRAEDEAGNVTTSTTRFETRASLDGLRQLITRFAQDGAIDNKAKKSLLKRVDKIAGHLDDPPRARRDIDRFVRDVQRDVHDAEVRTVLIRDAQALRP
ncbi:glycosyl hydrolase [Acrocarpospora pleiomorpha]|uniref:Glycosyl hydrolase n=1 Tax=Acrocarpospora pleiomorpha TaxID=90975 RepID=A0A5M3XKQ6_9ACTN|nr:PQQ-dependent sugar dehydrogenase [Acrocarpospora pleiomorpha]GES19733.1 glycosyl hydrolase [Acrocarpospora pleiomorpha]